MKFIIKTEILKNITNTLTKISAKEGLGTALNGVYIEVVQQEWSLSKHNRLTLAHSLPHQK